MTQLVVYLLVVFLGGALVAPWLHALTQAAAATWPVLAGLADQPFYRFVNRCLLVLALVGLWPLMKGLGARRWADVGLARRDKVGTQLAIGFVLGFAALALVALLALGAEARVLKPHYTLYDFVRKLSSAAMTAVVVGCLEEVLFRGAIFGALRRSHHWITALVISSVIYAIVHFFQRPADPETVRWFSGLVTLGGMLKGFVEWPVLVPGFFVLTLAGVILAYGYQRTGAIYFSIGLHAGWVFWLKFYGSVTTSQAGANLAFWGTRKLYDGWLSFLVLLLVFAGCLVAWREKHNGDRPQNDVDRGKKLA